MKTNHVKVRVAHGLNNNQMCFLKRMLTQGGPEEHEYDEFNFLVNSLSEDGIEELRDVLSPILTNLQTFQGFSTMKPYGYSGDFEIIDMFYKEKINPDPKYSKWDKWCNSYHAAQAVRNRKSFFINLMADLEKKSSAPKKVLILGSGPATDVYEYLKKNPSSKITFDLLDLDGRAIDYAKEKNKKFLYKMNFMQINVLRFKTHKTYDMIWSAGLFDYFKEKHFIYLLKKYLVFLASNGEMVIGNFSQHNPTRKLQEVLGDWYLNYRSDFELIKIAIEAGVTKEQVRIDKEPLGVNLFMRIEKNNVHVTERNEPVSKVSNYNMN